MHSVYSCGAVSTLAFGHTRREACLHDTLLGPGAHRWGWLGCRIEIRLLNADSWLTVCFQCTASAYRTQVRGAFVLGERVALKQSRQVKVTALVDRRVAVAV